MQQQLLKTTYQLPLEMKEMEDEVATPLHEHHARLTRMKNFDKDVNVTLSFKTAGVMHSLSIGRGWYQEEKKQ